MKSKKIHFTTKPNCPAKNNKNIITTDDYRGVTCDHCKKSKQFLHVQSEAEEKRPLNADEFKIPKTKLEIDAGEVEEPFSGNFTQEKQQSSHYQKGVETIKKIDAVLTHLDEKITAKEGYLIGNIIKYIDRLGLKDTIEKDSYKASDYIMRLINNKWIKDV